VITRSAVTPCMTAMVSLKQAGVIEVRFFGA
jgi:hypothetical protein